MWTATQDGFFSAVQHREHPDVLVIRARSKADLDKLLLNLAKFGLRDHEYTDVAIPEKGDGIELATLVKSERFADYPWRTYLYKSDWGQYLALTVEAITYDNFKNRIHDLNDDRANTYMKVWQALLDIEAEDGAETQGHNQWHFSGPELDDGPEVSSWSIQEVCDEYGFDPSDFGVPPRWKV